MIPQTHNIHIMRGETVQIDIGYNVEVTANDLFACIRETPASEQYLAKFKIAVNKDDLQPGDTVTISMYADTDTITINKAFYDLFIWKDGKPSKCLVKGMVYIHNSISDRGK